MGNKPPTLCWDCAHAAQGKNSECPWAREFRPVKGWTATEYIISCGPHSADVVSYGVSSCPRFLRDAYNAGLCRKPGEVRKRAKRAV